MYESFFQLDARPFLATPTADRYFPAASIEGTRETVARCIERAEGPAVVLGAAGTGKSILCQVLSAQFRAQFLVATLDSARLCTRRALLQNILFELKLPYRDREEGELRLSLIDHLEPSEACPNGMLLVVDEAHMLPLRLLEEIRMITNLVRDGQPRVRLVLAASLVLDERLTSPRLESFNQRIAARCYLQAMNRDETCGYVRAQISNVGGVLEQVFAEDALHAVYRATDGVPRLINQVCDHVLMMAAIGRHAPIDAAGVEEAWADLQQLPTPWNAVNAEIPSSEGGILEFGELDDAPPVGELDDAPPVGELDECDGDVQNDDALAPPSVSVDATDRLDEIESGISAISDEEQPLPAQQEADDEQQQFQPAASSETEIELVFHHAHDPFNESFDEEEVIVDPFASLEVLNGSSAPVSADSANSTIPFCPPEEAAEKHDVDSRTTAVDPVFPGDTQDVGAASPADSTGGDTHLPSDDRDLLDIQDDFEQVTDSPAAVTARPPRRREYRQLFADLRRR